MTGLSLKLDTPDLARHYEAASADRQFTAGKLLVEKLAVKPGDRVLDIGSGTGLLAEHVAGIVGASGSVTAIDPLPLRIEIAKQKARANLTFKVGDAYRLEGFATEGFDVVYLNAVFHWLPEKRGPLKEFRRLLRAGGRLGITTGSAEQLNTQQAIRKRVLEREPFARYPESREGVAHRVTPAELRALLEEAGFAVKALEHVPSVTYQPSGDAAIEFSQASSFGNFLGHLPPELQVTAREEIVRELEAHRTPEGIRLEGLRIFAIAERF